MAKTPKKVDRSRSLDPSYVTFPLQLRARSSSCSAQDALLPKKGSKTSGASTSRLHTQSPDIDLEAAGDVPLIGIFMHGGGYCHMSADEKSPTSKIPRRLTEVRTTRGLEVLIDCSSFSRDSQDGRFTEIYCALVILTPFALMRTHLLPPSCRI